MSAHVAACGRLVADPESRAGKPWATARLAMSLPLPYGADEGDDPPTLWLGVTVFGERGADNLARHRKGDSLSIAGRLELCLWTDREGVRREGWAVVIGPRTGWPGGGGAGGRSSARNGRGDGARRPAPSQDPMPEDDIPF